MTICLVVIALVGQVVPPFPTKAGAAVATFDSAVAVGAMNRERRRCGSPEFRADDRLMEVAKARFDQLPDNGYSHSLADGSNPAPALKERFGFRGETTEGLVIGGNEPAGLAVLEEQVAEPRFVPPPKTHHADMIDPTWTLVGFAAGIDKNGVACSVAIYGREVAAHEGPFPAATSPRRWVPLLAHPGWEAFGVIDEVAHTVAVEQWRYVGPTYFQVPTCSPIRAPVGGCFGGRCGGWFR